MSPPPPVFPPKTTWIDFQTCLFWVPIFPHLVISLTNTVYSWQFCWWPFWDDENATLSKVIRDLQRSGIKGITGSLWITWLGWNDPSLLTIDPNYRPGTSKYMGVPKMVVPQKHTPSAFFIFSRKTHGKLLGKPTILGNIHMVSRRNAAWVQARRNPCWRNSPRWHITSGWMDPGKSAADHFTPVASWVIYIYIGDEKLPSCIGIMNYTLLKIKIPPLKINGCKMYFLLSWSLFRGHSFVFKGVSHYKDPDPH